MNIVAIQNENSKIFESQSYTKDEEILTIEGAILNDAQNNGVSVNLETMTDQQLSDYIKSH